MHYQVKHRRECAQGMAVDVHCARPLKLAEYMELAEQLEASCRIFGTVLWLETSEGRITASTQVQRMSLRSTRLEALEHNVTNFVGALP